MMNEQNRVCNVTCEGHESLSQQRLLLQSTVFGSIYNSQEESSGLFLPDVAIPGAFLQKVVPTQCHTVMAQPLIKIHLLIRFLLSCIRTMYSIILLILLSSIIVYDSTELFSCFFWVSPTRSLTKVQPLPPCLLPHNTLSYCFVV